MKTILGQVNELMEHLDQSLLKCSEAYRLNNKALLRVITDLSKIRAQINAQVVDPKEEKKHTSIDPEDMEVDPQNTADSTQTQPEPKIKAGHAQHPISIPSQTPTTQHRTIVKTTRPIEKETKWKPAVVLEPAEDAEDLGLEGVQKTRPPPPTMEEVEDTDSPRAPTHTMETPETPSIQIPLRDIRCKYNQALDDINTLSPPDPSQWLLWDANGTHPDKAPRRSETARRDRVARREAEGIGEETQYIYEALEKEIQENTTPPTQPRNPGAILEQRFQEDRRKHERDKSLQEVQAEEQMAWLTSYGVNI